MRTSRQIRQEFLDFFVKKYGHTFVPSSPVVPHDDPTLLFTNAGMNQFKPYFLGTVKPPYPRAANTQKCIRAGGKHNDLEDVGKDTYHHTFFEMLGNWSFGDYFKKEAIEWAWELLTEVWGIEKDRLHATYFQGDPAEGLQPDLEARELWLKLLPAERIHPGNKKDNFWEMGETGPCGPCTEIHIDLTPDKSGGKLVNAGDARVMEIWNLVFIQFNRTSAGLSPLPAKHVDTGMGFERLCSVLQKTGSNYDTDVFTPIFQAIADVTQARPYARKLEDPIDTAYRVIADHIRTLTFALTDGAQITNEGRGYVLRRILRRAVRHGWQTLNLHEPFLYRLVPAVVDAMGDAFPELKKNPQAVMALIKEEEQSFERTLDRGIALFEEAAQSARVAGAPQAPAQISAENAFKLHDTYGFPLDLTQVMAEERGMSVDIAGFETLMEQARQQARAGGGSTVSLHDEKLRRIDHIETKLRSLGVPLGPTNFVGYDQAELGMENKSYVALWVLRPEGFVDAQLASTDQEVAVILASTPFYAESGGQVSDTGYIQFGSEYADPGRIKVSRMINCGGYLVHIGKVVHGNIHETKGPVSVVVVVDRDRRKKIMANHTATHVLNRALRMHVSKTADQKGSLVDEQKLRFDFSHNAALTLEQLEATEKTVNDDIAVDLPVYWGYAPQEQALKIHGLRAVFGEKYPPTVRVVSVGVPVEELLKNPENPQWGGYSIEFCGGTHLTKTGEAEGLVIVQEEAVGKGVRRITALTGPAAHEAAAKADLLLHRLESLRGCLPEKLADLLADLASEMNAATLPAVARAKLREGIAQLQKVVKDFEKQKNKQAAGGAVEEAQKIAQDVDGQIIVAEIPGADGDALRSAMDVIRKKKPDSALLLGGVAGDKVSFVAAVPEALIKKGLKAGDWVKEAAKVAGGGGGGRPDMAQAGGKDPAKLGEALDAARKFAVSKV